MSSILQENSDMSSQRRVNSQRGGHDDNRSLPKSPDLKTIQNTASSLVAPNTAEKTSFFNEIASRDTDSSRKKMSMAHHQSLTPLPNHHNVMKIMDRTSKKLPALHSDSYNSRSNSGFAQRMSEVQSSPNKEYNFTRRSNESNFLNVSKSGANLVQDKFDFIRSKQEKDLDRWKRKLAIQKEQTNYLDNKGKSIEELLERKSTQVLEM